MKSNSQHDYVFIEVLLWQQHYRRKLKKGLCKDTLSSQNNLTCFIISIQVIAHKSKSCTLKYFFK